MVGFFIKRFIGLIFVLLGVTFITFILGYYAPGDPIRNLLGNHFEIHTYLRLRHEYGLDLPWYQQYFNYVVQLLRFNFGDSYYFQETPVLDILKPGIPVSAELGLWGLVLTFLIGVPIGILAALKANTWIDTSSMSISLILYSLPSFILAVFFQVIVVFLDSATNSHWPVAGWGNAWQYTPSDLAFKIGPIFVYAAVGFAFIARLTRTTMLEVLRQDYVRTARAKGLKEQVVNYRHAFRNALIPLVTVFGTSLATLVGGVFFIEVIFNIPGIGQIGLNAINDRDYTVIQATGVIFAIAVVIGNLVADLLYSAVDPRIKVE
jgi:peptide/nickel transport system permease protein/oligopeptide transport system permease protein